VVAEEGTAAQIFEQPREARTRSFVGRYMNGQHASAA
jgi:polar amino acid transport system ATP-binding protein